jgi:hypothetical protein
MPGKWLVTDVPAIGLGTRNVIRSSLNVRFQWRHLMCFWRDPAMMKFDRNRCLILGIVLLLLGVQYRVIAAVTLTPDATRVLAKYTAPKQSDQIETARMFAPQQTDSVAKKEIRPPRWAGLSMIAVGSVLILNSFVMRRPG